MSSVVNSVISALGHRWGLTARETEVLCEIICGSVASKDLAHALSISTSTAEKHVESISRKSALSGRTELVSFFLATFTKVLATLDSSDPSHELARVAVWDDDRDLTDALVTALQHHGLDAYAVPSNSSGLTSPDSSPEVLICDYVLGEMNGIQLAQSIRSTGLGAPSIILITGFPERLAHESSERETILFKPLDDAVLARATWRAVSSAQLRRRLLRILTAI